MFNSVNRNKVNGSGKKLRRHIFILDSFMERETCRGRKACVMRDSG